MTVSVADLLIALPATETRVADVSTAVDGLAQVEASDFHREFGRALDFTQLQADRPRPEFNSVGRSTLGRRDSELTSATPFATADTRVHGVGIGSATRSAPPRPFVEASAIPEHPDIAGPDIAETPVIEPIETAPLAFYRYPSSFANSSVLANPADEIGQTTITLPDGTKVPVRVDLQSRPTDRQAPQVGFGSRPSRVAVFKQESSAPVIRAIEPESAVAPASARESTEVPAAYRADAVPSPKSAGDAGRFLRRDFRPSTNTDFSVSNDGTAGVAPAVGDTTNSTSSDAPVLLPFTGQVASAVTQSLRDEALPADTIRELTIRLDPPELGALRIRMRATDAGMEVDVEAADEVTLEMLSRRVPEIEQLLRMQKTGVQVLTVNRLPSDSGDASMTLGGNDQSSDHGLQGERQSGHDQDSRRQHLRRHLNQDSPGTQPVTVRRSQGGIRA